MEVPHIYLNTSFPKSCRVLYEEALCKTDIIKSGCSSLDQLLKGGLWTGELLEVCGAPGSGKTQFCKMACSSLLRSTDNTAFYIDASGSFVYERLLEMLASQNAQCTPQFLQDSLSRINYLRVFSAQSLLIELRKLEEQLTVKTTAFFCQLKLLILDSISPLISPILGGGQTQGHMLMMEIGRLMKRLAVEHNISCIVVNGIVMDPCHGKTMFRYKPALGKSWISVPHRRVYFESIEDGESAMSCMAFLTKCNRQASGHSVKFHITAKGLEC